MNYTCMWMIISIISIYSKDFNNTWLASTIQKYTQCGLPFFGWCDAIFHPNLGLGQGYRGGNFSWNDKMLPTHKMMRMAFAMGLPASLPKLPPHGKIVRAWGVITLSISLDSTKRCQLHWGGVASHLVTPNTPFASRNTSWFVHPRDHDLPTSGNHL